MIIRLFTASAVALIVAMASTSASHADRGKDESGHGRWQGKHGEYKEEYRDGNCKVERKWGKSGEYKEEIKCKGGYPAPVYYAPPPAYAHSYPAEVFVPQATDIFACNRDLIGSIIGGAAGGLAGSQVGQGTGRVVATAAGTLIGVLVGGEIGRSMDGIDQACAGQVLEQVQSNRTVRWRNPDGAAYEMTPMPAYADGGRQCREFTSVVTIGGRRQQAYGTACRQPDGSWQITG